MNNKKSITYLTVAITLILQVINTASFAQPQSLDLTFSTDGMTTTYIGYYNYGRSVAVQSDGKILLAGYSSATGSADYNFAIVRYNVSGSLDNTWGTSGIVLTDFGTLNYDAAEVVTVQTDGKILVGGLAYNTATSSFGFAMARYNTNGTLDASFDTDGKVMTPIGTIEDNIRDVIVQSDGKIIVVGYSDNGTNDNSVIARYNSNGSLDNTFGTGGITVTAVSTAQDWIVSAALQSDGKIVAAGFNINGTDQEMLLIRYNANGTIDNTFGTSGMVTMNYGVNADLFRSVAIQSDGKIVAAGSSYNGTQYVFALARFNTNGTLDNTFNSTGKVSTAIGTINDQGQELALQSDGKIVVGGISSNGNDLDFGAARYNTNGSLDVGFDGDGKLTTDITGGLDDYCHSIALSPTDGKIVLGGYYQSGGSGYELAVARYCPKASQPGTINGNATPCGSSTETYSITAVAGADDYTWTVPSGATINSGQGTTSISVTFGAINGNVTVMANNDCGSSSVQTKAIIVSNTPVTPGTIAGSAAMCEGTTQTYSVSLVSGASGYTWTVPVGTTINSGQGTNSISVTIGYASGNIEVTANNACGTSSASSYPITVTPLPYSFFSWSSVGLAVTFTNLSLNGTTYAWVFGDAGTSAAPNPVHNYSTAGTYTVELTVTNACGTGYYTTNITITATGNGGDVGIEETVQTIDLSIYPNPTTGKFRIVIGDETIQNHQKYTIEIFNLFGQIVHQLGMDKRDSEIDLSSFSNGIYYVKCISETGEGMVKIVKQ